MESLQTKLPRASGVPLSERPLSVAIVYSRLPLPMTRADQMTVAHLIEFLSARGHTVDLFTLANGESITPEQRAWLHRRCRNVHLFRQGKIRRLAGVTAGLLRRRPLQVAYFHNRAQARTVRAAVAAGGYDVVYCYTLRSAEALRGLARLDWRNRKRPALFLAMQVSQALNIRRMIESFTNWRDLAVYHLEYRLIRRYEARIWREFDRTVLIGPKDVEEVRRICRDLDLPEIDNFIYGPHGTDVSAFAPRPDVEPEPDTLIFTGSLKTNTNANAITWFADNVWPLVRRGAPRARLLIVGHGPRPEVRALGARGGIEVVGEVPDMAEHIARATVCINPMQAGAGMQNKLVESMAMAKPVVATTVANEGIGAHPGEHLLIADTPSDFADAVLALLRDPGLRAALGAAARRFVERNWTWEGHFLQLEQWMYEARDDVVARGNDARSGHGPAPNGDGRLLAQGPEPASGGGHDRRGPPAGQAA